jgi:Spy/CpxP family protein refolding chaperone
VNRWKVIPTIVLATVLIFGAGVFTGGTLVNRVKTSGVKKTAAQTVAATNCPTLTTSNAVVKPADPNQDFLTKPFLAKLDEQLKLTADQHKSVEKIINDSRDDVKKTTKFAKMQIREVLTPEQVKLFDALFKKAPKKAADTNAPPTVLSVTNSTFIPLTNQP